MPWYGPPLYMVTHEVSCRGTVPPLYMVTHEVSCRGMVTHEVSRPYGGTLVERHHVSRS
jgi:hypothetical protein